MILCTRKLLERGSKNLKKNLLIRNFTTIRAFLAKLTRNLTRNSSGAGSTLKLLTKKAAKTGISRIFYSNLVGHGGLARGQARDGL